MSWDDDGRFPKDRGFPRSQPGRAALRLIDANDSTVWLRKRRMTADGIAEARNKGGYLTVKAGTPPPPDGFYSLGSINSLLQVVGDGDGRGAFKLRGPYTDSDSTGIGSQSSLFVYGDGRGGTLAIEHYGFYLNRQGYACRVWLVTIWLTRNGTKFAPRYQYLRVVPSSGVVPDGLVVYFNTNFPARFGPDRSQRVAASPCSVDMDGDGNFFFYYVKDMYSSVQVVTMPTTPDQYPWQGFTFRLSPSTLLAFTQYIRSRLPEKDPETEDPILNRIDNSACPGYRFLFSMDNGSTWLDASGGDLFQEFDDTILTLPGIDPLTGTQLTQDNATFLTAVATTSFEVAPVSATRAVCYAIVPYLDGAGDLMYKVKLGVVDSAARTVFATLTLFDGPLDKAQQYSAGFHLTSVAGGVVSLRNPSADRENPPQPFYTVDGVSLASQPPFAVPTYACGRVEAINKKEVGLTAFMDGEYVLMSSTDLGATWKKRAVLANEGAAPPNTDLYFLSNFTAVTQLLDLGRVASATPGAPWICDSRIDPPL